MRLRNRSIAGALLAGSLVAASVGGAAAQDAKPGDTTDNQPATPETSGKPAAEAPTAPAVPSIQSSLGPYGDPGGIRAFLDARGIDYNFTYIGEVLGNSTGGLKQGATYEGRLDGQLDIDLEKLAGIKNTAIHANFYQLHGRGLTGNNTFDTFTVSGIEAYPSTKLYEAWIEEKVLDGKVFVRVGQLAADTEFFVSQSATLFISATFGWPAIFANDLPSSGPAFPLATPGVRLKVAPTDNLTFLAAVFDGNPAGVYTGNNAYLPQIRDLNGTLFRVKDPPLIMAETSYAYNQEKDAKGLPGTVKFGYVHLFPSNGNIDALAPGIVGSPQVRDDGAYAIIDQTVYVDPKGPSASVFARASVFPSDRNPYDAYIDAGVIYKGLIPGRPDDTAGISGAYDRFSPIIAAEFALGNPGILPARQNQALIEATYQYVVIPGFTLQPDFQYLINPGGNGAMGFDGVPLRNAAVFGLRATIHY